MELWRHSLSFCSVLSRSVRPLEDLQKGHRHAIGKGVSVCVEPSSPRGLEPLEHEPVGDEAVDEALLSEIEMLFSLRSGGLQIGVPVDDEHSALTPMLMVGGERIHFISTVIPHE